MNIVIIGSGNVATVLAHRIIEAKHCIQQIYSHNLWHAKKLAKICKCTAVNNWNNISQNADLYLIAISDNALSNIPIKFNNKLVVHTAGAVSKMVLKNTSNQYGVLYPLQSLLKNVTDNAVQIPILIDANNKTVLSKIEIFAKSLSPIVYKASDKKRLKLHVAAVLVNNFVNHLYNLTSKYCKSENIDFNLLLPLIDETTNRLKHHTPQQMQTGPAIRNDTITLKKHLDVLKNNSDLQLLYAFFTKGIIQLQK